MLTKQHSFHQNAPDKKIQNYQFSLKSNIGSGSYGKVYYGVNIQTQLPVAIKVIQMQLIENDEYMYNQLQNEITCMKNVKGENIVKLLDVFLTKNNAYIIQEFCNGGDLRAAMREAKNEPFTEELALKIMRDIVKGFQSLVSANIIHRDLKPENILRNDDVYKLADFGFAKQVNNLKSGLLTSSVGTPLYMSPQILKSEKYTSKSDIWSIGLILYEMLFGKTPWPSNSQYNLIMNIQNVPLQFPYKIKISDHSKQFLKSCLEPDEKIRMDWKTLFSHPLIIGSISPTLTPKQTQNSNTQKKIELTQPPLDSDKMQLDNKAKLLIQKLQYLITNNKVDIKKLFETLDKSGDNVLDFKEFRRLLNCLDPQLGLDAAEHIFKKFDTNGDKEISQEEFYQLIMETDYSNYEMNKDPFLETKAQRVLKMIKFMINAYQINIRKLLATFDKQNKNELNFQEFSEMISKMNQIFAKKSGDLAKSDELDYNISTVEMQYIFRKLDEDGNGSVSQDELEKALEILNTDKEKFVNQLQKAKSNSEMLLDKKAFKIISEIKHIIAINAMDIQQIFTNFDLANKGALNLQEFTKMIKIIDETMNYEEIEYVFRIFDVNNDKSISLEEFETYIK